ncbi:hypothetical protein ACFPOU_16075 [Massilia jejuensis]|uniref:Uncharacterized protein n=1 Tax=Massilia jejuensis TaxID=648894 RepID=A0ABW0PLM9_9BURK
MIQSLDGDSVVGPDLKAENLKDYWAEYFAYLNQGAELHELTRNELLTLVARAKQSPRPHIDSQIEINKLLTDLGATRSFHRQFSERFPGSRPPQVLSMQLYALLAADSETWRYMKSAQPAHFFAHSNYFIAAPDAGDRS